MSVMEASVDEAMDERAQDYATAAVSALEDMRGLARDVGKFTAKAGLPIEFQAEASRIQLAIEEFESRVSEHTVEVCK